MFDVFGIPKECMRVEVNPVEKKKQKRTTSCELKIFFWMFSASTPGT